MSEKKQGRKIKGGKNTRILFCQQHCFLFLSLPFSLLLFPRVPSSPDLACTHALPPSMLAATRRRAVPAATASEPKLDGSGDAIASTIPNGRKTLSSRPQPSPPSPPSLLIALVGGLLSSSCCIVQLALNALAFGCAGFAALDKFRAPAAAATAAALVFSERRRRRRQHRKASNIWRALLPFALAGLLAASPEITAAVSRYGGVSSAVMRAKEFAFELSPLKAFSSSSSSLFSSSDAGSASASAAAIVVKKKKTKLRLTGVKCAACGERARAAAAGAASPFGAAVSVDWQKAEATVEIPSSGPCVGEGCAQEASDHADSVLSGVIEALGGAGFGASAAEEEEEES